MVVDTVTRVYCRFLPCDAVHIAVYAGRMSVHPSVTLRYGVKTARDVEFLPSPNAVAL